MALQGILEGRRTRSRQPINMRGEHRQAAENGHPGRGRAQIVGAARMAKRGDDETGDQIDGIILAEHRERSRRARRHRPGNAARIERAQKAISGKRPGRQQHGVGREPLAVKLVERRQQEQQQHQQAPVGRDVAARDEIDREQPDGGIDRREQMKRPVGDRKDRKPRRRDQRRKRWMLFIAGRGMLAPREQLEHVVVQADRREGDDLEARPDRHEQREQDPHRAAVVAFMLVPGGNACAAREPMARRLCGAHGLTGCLSFIAARAPECARPSDRPPRCARLPYRR